MHFLHFPFLSVPPCLCYHDNRCTLRHITSTLFVKLSTGANSAFDNTTREMTSESDDVEPDFVILFPADLGHPNAVYVHKHVLAAKSPYFDALFQRKPDIDAYCVRRKIYEHDIRAVLDWMYDPSCDVGRWPDHTLAARFAIAKKLQLQSLCDAIFHAASQSHLKREEGEGE